MWTGSITQQGKRAGTGLVAPIACAVADANDKRKRSRRAGHIGFAGFAGYQIGAADIEWLVDYLHRHIAGNAVATALFGYEGQLERIDKPIAAIREKYIERVIFGAQIAIAIGERKRNAKGVIGRSWRALCNGWLTERKEIDFGYIGVIRWLCATCAQETRKQRAEA